MSVMGMSVSIQLYLVNQNGSSSTSSSVVQGDIVLRKYKESTEEKKLSLIEH